MHRDKARKFFAANNETYKVELIDGIKDQEVSIYKTGDEFVDLCKGPHVASTGLIKGFKLLSVAGAYWRGDEKRPMLQRIYGTAFFTQKELDEYLKMLEEAGKRDHRKIATQLDLFHIYHETAGAGLVFYHPNGAMLRKIIEDYTRAQHLKRGYQLVMTPNILKGKLWDISGHAENYRENMYYFKVDDEDYAVKPMNCPGHILIYKSQTRSYRDLPVRYFELGTVYRQEKAGVLHGLLRVRGFTQDDAHIFLRPEQIKNEVIDVIDFVFDTMKDFGFNDLHIELSTRPEKFMGTIANWDKATAALKDALDTKELKYDINEGDGAFYGPKIDIKLKDAIGRQWQCGTIQCDFFLPERFELNYVDETGAQAHAGHAAPGDFRKFGKIHRHLDRALCREISHYGWRLIKWRSFPIKNEHQGFALQIKTALQQADIRVVVDDRNESLSKRIREASVKKIPYQIIIGDKEAQSSQVTVRLQNGSDLGAMSLEALLGRLKQQIIDKTIEFRDNRTLYKLKTIQED